MEVRVGDYGYNINFTVKDTDGTVVNLTGIEAIYFRVREVDSDRNILNGTCSVVVAASGTCKYTVQNNDFDKEGNYTGGLVLKYSSVKKVTTKDFAITVKRSLKLA
jgi:hypothetical protein